MWIVEGVVKLVTSTSVGSPPVEPERLRATELHVVLNWTEELKERMPN